MCLEFFGDKVEIVPASVAEESGIERESDAGWRCRRFLEIQEHFPSDLNPFRLASCDREEEKPDPLSIHFASGHKNLHKLVRSNCRMGAGADGKEDQTSNNNDQ